MSGYDREPTPQHVRDAWKSLFGEDMPGESTTADELAVLRRLHDLRTDALKLALQHCGQAPLDRVLEAAYRFQWFILAGQRETAAAPASPGFD